MATPTLIGTAGDDVTTLLLSINTTVSDDSVAVELETFLSLVSARGYPSWINYTTMRKVQVLVLMKINVK